MPVQVPQSATVRAPPQLSVVLKDPQTRPAAAQSWTSVSGLQPQTPAVPPPPQVRAVAQVPQLATVRAPPQLSVVLKDPQVRPAAAQSWASVSGEQPQTPVVPPPPQVCAPRQVPQLAMVRAVPQLSVPVTGPQEVPWSAQKAAFDCGAQPQRPALPPPPQTWGRLQPPQLATVRLAPQLSVAVTGPHSIPWSLQKAAVDSGVQAGVLDPLLQPVNEIRAMQRDPAYLCMGVTLPRPAISRHTPKGLLSYPPIWFLLPRILTSEFTLGTFSQ
jgi:hypothetical protein